MIASPYVFYRIPMAVGAVRVVMLCACLLAVVAIFGWTGHKMLNFLRTMSSRTPAQSAAGGAIFLIILSFGFLPLMLLLGLISNPSTLVTDEGVMRENLLHGKGASIAWKEIIRVDCRSDSRGRILAITVVAADGRGIQMGSGGGALDEVHEMFESRLGSEIVTRCTD